VLIAINRLNLDESIVVLQEARYYGWTTSEFFRSATPVTLVHATYGMLMNKTRNEDYTLGRAYYNDILHAPYPADLLVMEKRFTT
jgi:hypothetical protein